MSNMWQACLTRSDHPDEGADRPPGPLQRTRRHNLVGGISAYTDDPPELFSLPFNGSLRFHLALIGKFFNVL